MLLCVKSKCDQDLRTVRCNLFVKINCESPCVLLKVGIYELEIIDRTDAGKAHRQVQPVLILRNANEI